MAIRFRKVTRLVNPMDKESETRTYPQILYKYDHPATLQEFAKEISAQAGVSEGETIGVLKDFRTLLRKTLLMGRSVNIEGLGYFFLSAHSKGTEKMEDFTAADIEHWHRARRMNGIGYHYVIRLHVVKELLREYSSIDCVCGHRDLSPDLNHNGEVEPEEWVKHCPFRSFSRAHIL